MAFLLPFGVVAAWWTGDGWLHCSTIERSGQEPHGEEKSLWTHWTTNIRFPPPDLLYIELDRSLGLPGSILSTSHGGLQPNLLIEASKECSSSEPYQVAGDARIPSVGFLPRVTLRMDLGCCKTLPS